MKPAIEVRNLGKEYKLGLTHTDLLSEKLGNGLRAIGRRFKSKNEKNSARQQIPHEQEQSFWALKDINFDVQQGEVMGVIGRNGAGKSTLLKILSRITSPTTGEIELRGRVASLLEVGTGFHAELTGRENIYLNGAILGMNRQEINKKFDEIVAFAEVDKFVDTPVKRYSSGMYVRLAFAVAAHLEPEILVVDEVLAVGDLAFQKKCLNKMEDVSGEGRTVLFVSHNMASIKRLCQSAILLEEGKIQLIGTAHEAITLYNNLNRVSSAAVDLDPSKHKSKSDLQIVRVEITGNSSHAQNLIFADNDINIYLILNVKGSFAGVNIGVEIFREGVLISALKSKTLRIGSSLENLEVSCGIQGGFLRPGFYDIHLGAVDAESGKSLDWVPEASSFNILDVFESTDEFHSEQYGGIINVPVTWSY